MVNLSEIKTEQKPLHGKRILVTRDQEQSWQLSNKIEELGGIPIEFPVIRITQPEDRSGLDQTLLQLDPFRWIIFTSVNGVGYFFRRLEELGLDFHQQTQAKVIAIGPKTREALIKKGVQVDSLPKKYQAEGLIDLLRSLVKAGEQVLLPRGNLARGVLPVELKKIGCKVTEVITYETRIHNENAENIVTYLENNKVDIITFTSSSTVRNFTKGIREVRPDYHSLLTDCTIACIGPVTADSAKELGLAVTIVADPYTIDGLVDSLVTYVVNTPSLS